MYAKLFSRIVESSLMETPIEVRYTFVFMLAIADPNGHVIGTDIAIARRLNMPLDEFQRCVRLLMLPDTNSNSTEEEGRRVVTSDVERGYKMVNYLTYRDLRNAEERRDYMREYMQRRRQLAKDMGVEDPEAEEAEEEFSSEAEAELTRVNSVNNLSSEVSSLAEAEEGSRKKKQKHSGFENFWSLYPRKVAKGYAIKAWEKLNPDSQLQALIASAIITQFSEVRDMQFVKHPATWLNGRCWEDEIPGASVASPAAQSITQSESDPVDLSTMLIEEAMAAKVPLREFKLKMIQALRAHPEMNLEELRAVLFSHEELI